MAAVKIIKGSYGHKSGSSVVPVYAGETVELTEEQAARLVKLGVAEYTEKAEAPIVPETDSESELPEYNEGMKLSELKAIAEQYGIDASAAKTKKDVIALIEAAQQELPEISSDDTVVDE